MSNIVGGCGTVGKIVILLVVLAVIGLIVVVGMRGSQMRDARSKIGGWLKAPIAKDSKVTHGDATKTWFKGINWGKYDSTPAQ